MPKSNCTIVIPVYKLRMDEWERKSFEQGLKIFHGRPIILIAPEGLYLTEYEQIAQKYDKHIEVKTFNPVFFCGVKGYNDLMLSYEFYASLKAYKYILIYQLDAYVFSDNLDYWCAQNFDYIGSPWFKNCGYHENGDDLWLVGNGGFSLRKVNKFRKLLKSHIPLRSKPLHDIFNRLFLNNILYLLGRKNNINHLLKHNIENEDIFYCRTLSDTRAKLKTPSPEIASQFAFERSPRYLYELNGEKLPMGCHAYRKYDYDSFWSKYIK